MTASCHLLTEAGRGLVADSSLYRLATALCGTRHAAKVAAYPPVLLWCGAAVAFCGLWTPARRRARYCSDEGGSRQTCRPA